MVLFFKKEHLPPWSLEQHKNVRSTQDLATTAAQNGAVSRHAYLAERQSAGRGRQDRVWESEAGNLYLSALLRPSHAAPVPAFWSLMAGLAVQDTAQSFLPSGPRAMLKWPNDVLLEGGKLGGVLIDSALGGAGTLDWVVIGAGVNLAHAPSLPDRPTSCLAQYGAKVAPRAFAERLLAGFDRWVAMDLAAIRAAWLERAHPPGTLLRVRHAGQVMEGAFDGLAEDGALMLRGHAPMRTGEVMHDAVPGALPVTAHPDARPAVGPSAGAGVPCRQEPPHAAGG